jgi:hypothetical protein
MSATDSAKQTTSEIATFLKAQSPELKARIEAIEHFMDHPVAKVGGTLVQDQEFTSSFGKLLDSGKGSTLLAYEAVLILVLWGFRAWRLGKVNTLFARLLTQAWIAVLYWVLALVVVPSVLLGESYRVVLTHSARALLRQILS